MGESNKISLLIFFWKKILSISYVCKRVCAIYTKSSKIYSLSLLLEPAKGRKKLSNKHDKCLNKKGTIHGILSEHWFLIISSRNY